MSRPEVVIVSILIGYALHQVRASERIVFVAMENDVAQVLTPFPK
jgi:hypothetical protein